MIGRRIVAWGTGAVLVMVVAAVVLTGVRRNIEGALQTQNQIVSVQRMWDRSLVQEAARVRAATLEALRVSHTGSAKPGGGIGIDPLSLATLEHAGIASCTVFDSLGLPVMVWPLGSAPEAVDGRRVAQVIAGHGAFETIAGDGADVHLVVGGSMASLGEKAGFVTTAPLEPVLSDVVESSGASGYLIGRDGQPMAARGTLDWAELRAAYRDRDSEVQRVTIGNDTVDMVVLPLRNASRVTVAHLVLVHDLTLQVRWLDVLDALSVTALIVLCVTLATMLRWYIGRSLGPLDASITAMSKLAEGDTGVEVLGVRRRDEIGKMARSLQIFRDRVRRLRDSETSRGRQWTRQREFIRAQMLQIAETLPDDGRQAFHEDLARIEAAADHGGGDGGDRSLAVAVEVMASRVREQHGRLADLVTELRTALETKTELFQLQQQVEVARRMQQSMVPRGLLPRSDIDVVGALEPAREFEGAFYDYFSLEDGRLAVTLGQPSRGGLAAGFLSATARASLRALLAAGLSPGQAVERTAAMLVGEEETDGYAVAAALIDPSRSALAWAAAGVEAPFLVRRLGDAVDVPVQAAKALSSSALTPVTEQSFDLPQRATLVILSPGALAAAGSGADARTAVADVLRAADDMSASGLVDAARRGGIVGRSVVATTRDKLCIAVRLID